MYWKPLQVIFIIFLLIIKFVWEHLGTHIILSYTPVSALPRMLFTPQTDQVDVLFSVISLSSFQQGSHDFHLLIITKWDLNQDSYHVNDK